MTDSDTITGLLATVLESAWAAIRSHHPDVPDVILTAGAGSTGGNELTSGHFAPNRWVRGESELHELFIGGERLQRGPVDVLDILPHEARPWHPSYTGVKDTSRQGLGTTSDTASSVKKSGSRSYILPGISETKLRNSWSVLRRDVVAKGRTAG